MNDNRHSHPTVSIHARAASGSDRMDDTAPVVLDCEDVSIYYGAGCSPSDAQPVADALKSNHPGIHVDLIEGGQPHHQFLASVE